MNGGCHLAPWRLILAVAAVGHILGTALEASAPASAANDRGKPFLLVPTGRMLVQRGFVPCEGALKLYGCVVGSPAGIHYAYDFETGALLSVWRGPFADVSEMWVGRAFGQTARPAGDEIALSALPLVACFPNRLLAYPQVWPERPDPLYASQGYELEPNGQPVFLATLEDLHIRDRIAPAPDRRGLVRRVELSGRSSLWNTWLLLGAAESITVRSPGIAWSSGPEGWTVEWPQDSKYRPAVWQAVKRQQLVVRIEPELLDQPVIYTVVW